MFPELFPKTQKIVAGLAKIGEKPAKLFKTPHKFYLDMAFFLVYNTREGQGLFDRFSTFASARTRKNIVYLLLTRAGAYHLKNIVYLLLWRASAL